MIVASRPRLTPADYGRAPVLSHVDVVDVALEAMLLALGEPHCSRWPMSDRPDSRSAHQADLVVGLANALLYVLGDYRKAIIDLVDDDIPF